MQSVQVMSPNPLPLVSIGLPVRNGGKFIRIALELLVKQTYSNLEILISNNQSTDETASIIEEFASKDHRIRVFNQDTPLTALSNFRFVFEKASGEYFMWAAHDDRRDTTYVEKLVRALIRHPDSSLAFGDAYLISDGSEWDTDDIYPFEFSFEESLPALNRVLMFGCRDLFFNIYGLIRTSRLRKYKWSTTEDYMPDLPLMVFLSLTGNFVKVDDCNFYYFYIPGDKTPQDRAIANNLSSLKRFPEMRVAWCCAKTATESGNFPLRFLMVYPIFLMVFSFRAWRRVKPKIFNVSPNWLIYLYRRFLKH